MISTHVKQRAFTLIEVMAALAIVAVAIAALLTTVSQQVQAATRIKNLTYANWIAQNRIAEIRLENETPEVSETDTEVFFAGLEWSVVTNISETGVENLYRIDVDVGFAASDDIIRTVTGFVGPPTIPGQANAAWAIGPQNAGAEE